MTRWTVVAVVLGLLVAGVLYDRVDIAQAPTPLPVDEPVVIPSLRGERLSNVWFCPVGSGGSGGYATHELTVTNLGDDVAVATIDLVTNDGPGPGLQVEVSPRTTEIVDVAGLDPAPNLGAVVEVVGGRGVVGHSVITARGQAQGPCSSDTDQSWFFADGVTTRDSQQYIVLLNPYPEDASFSMTFQTTTRTREPEDLKSASVPGRSVRVVNVGEFVTREAHVATSITVGRGSLAVERLQVFDGELGPLGAALQLGTNRPAIEWAFPAGRVHLGGDHRLAIFNPSPEQAAVDVEFDLDPADRSAFGLVPIEVTVQPGRSVVLDLRQALEGYGLPLPYDFGVRVRSANEIPMVVERWQVTPMIDTTLIGAGGAQARRARAQTDSDPDEVPEQELDSEPLPQFVQPTATVGVASSGGAEAVSTTWVVPWVEIDPLGGTAVVVSGLEGTLVELQLVLAGELLPPVRATIPAAGIVSIPITTAVTAAPIIVSADNEVSVEVLVVVTDLRLSLIPAIPVLE